MRTPPVQRTVYGAVDTSAPGVIYRGSGDFLVARNGVGDVTITFLTPFAFPPSMILTAGFGATNYATKVSSSAGGISNRQIRVSVFTIAGAAFDGPFEFTAIGKALT